MITDIKKTLFHKRKSVFQLKKYPKVFSLDAHPMDKKHLGSYILDLSYTNSM